MGKEGETPPDSFQGEGTCTSEEEKTHSVRGKGAMEGFGLHITLFEDEPYNNLKAPLDRRDRIAPWIEGDNTIERQDVVLPNPPRRSVFSRLRDWIRTKREEKKERRREKEIAQLKRDLIEAKKKMGRIEHLLREQERLPMNDIETSI